MMRMAIVGGGISGLAQAYALEQLEYEGLPVSVDLFESRAVLGGVINTARFRDWAIEMGPDSLVDRPRGAVELCRRVGLADDVVSMRRAAKPPLLRGADGWTAFSRTETRSFTLAGGLDQLVDGLERSLQRTAIHRAWPVSHIARDSRGWYLDGEMGPFHGIILAVPATQAASLMKQSGLDTGWLSRVTYEPRAVVAAVYEEHSFPESDLLEHTGFVVAPEAGLGVTAVTWLSRKWSHFPQAGPLIMRTFWGPPGPNPDQWSDQALVDQHENALTVLVGAHARPSWRSVARYHTALPQVPANGGGAWEMKAGMPYLGIVGPFRNGPGVSDCVRTAWEESYRLLEWAQDKALLMP